jgi:hypothetical protein
MSASRYKDRYATEQEETELAQKEAHENFLCEGSPFCCYCMDEEQALRDLDELVDHVNKELDKK